MYAIFALLEKFPVCEDCVLFFESITKRKIGITNIIIEKLRSYLVLILPTSMTNLPTMVLSLFSNTNSCLQKSASMQNSKFYFLSCPALFIFKWQIFNHYYNILGLLAILDTYEYK